jgi:glycosyltransferase involved in cell wall biosynthesis
VKHVNNSTTFPKHEQGQKNGPLITVVTVVFNGKEFLEETIQSVIGQTYDNLEYIIIDGGSTDGTLDIIKKYENEIDCWISEQDKGIYDAMNKGIQIAKGEWINFMNAGDTFNSSDILVTVFNYKKYDGDILYGDVHVRYPEFSRIQSAGHHCHLWRGMQFCHQSIFVRSVIHKPNLFNATNLIAADFQFYYESYRNNIKFKHIDHVIASVLTGGISDTERVKTIGAWSDVVCVTGSTLPIKLYYKFLKINAIIRSGLKQVLPKKIINTIIMNHKRPDI